MPTCDHNVMKLFSIHLFIPISIHTCSAVAFSTLAAKYHNLLIDHVHGVHVQPCVELLCNLWERGLQRVVKLLHDMEMHKGSCFKTYFWRT